MLDSRMVIGAAQRMPELEWQFGYAYALGLMLVCTLALWLTFSRIQWL